jgi:inorganic pyrophosphatase/manganese-dependent inorganic pyrophosphatase
MKKRFVITAGYKFVDIDAFACIYAYREVLALQNIDAIAFISASPNSSVLAKYRGLQFYESDANLVTNMSVKDSTENRFVLVDVSDFTQFEKIVNLDFVEEIFDHHTGFEKFWKEKIGYQAIIEPIGAAATLIVREYKKHHLLEKISPMAAELLAAAILSNTLWFQLKMTTQEDTDDYKELQKYFSYTGNFEKDYFSQVQETIEKNIELSLKNDSKSIEISGLSLCIAQLEVWNAEHIIKDCSLEIETFLKNASEDRAFLNMVEIGGKRSVLICRDKVTMNYLQRYFPDFRYDMDRKKVFTNRAMLRKELLTRLYQDRKL